MSLADAALPSVVIGETQRSVASIVERGARLASVLQDFGIGAGDAVAVIARNDFVCLEAILAVRQIDAYVVLVNWHWKDAEIAHVLNDSGSRAVIAQAEFLPMLARIAPHSVTLLAQPLPAGSTLPDGVAVLDYDAQIAARAPSQARGSGRESTMVYTSGTTGKPKGVRRFAASADEIRQRRQLLEIVYGGAPGVRAIATGPLYHLYSQAVTMSTIGAGGSVVVMQRFDPEAFLRLVQEHRITHAHLVPTMFVRLLRLPEQVRHAYDLSSLRYVMHSAAPCAPEVKRAMIDWLGPIVWENYGSSETGVITLCDSEEWLARPGTVGRPVLTGEVRIYGEDGGRLASGEIGDIHLRMHGTPDFTYHGNEDARRKVDRDGFVTAGDMGYVDDEGYLFLCDRRIDMVISGGVNIYPMEIESELLAHPDVADAAVFGIPDQEYGEILCAHVQRRMGSTLDESELLAFLKARLAGYKLPRRIVFEDHLPREENGKIYKRKIREQYWVGHRKTI